MSETSSQILRIARDIIARDGIGAMSFDAIAAQLGLSKQAVLYWYPSKQMLLAALFLPWLEAEGDAVCAALSEARDRDGAVTAFVRALAAFHLSDIARFRMMYLVPQTLRGAGRDVGKAALLEKVHPLTDRVYAALAAHLEGDPRSARREAVVIHAAVLGQVLMISLSDTLDDPMKHSALALTEALVSALCRSAT